MGKRGSMLGVPDDPRQNLGRIRPAGSPMCYVNIDDIIRVWPLDTRFPTLLECFSYGKNLILKHVNDKGRIDTVDHIEWWLKGDEVYYCSHCMSPLAVQDRLNQGTASEVLHFTCHECHSEMRIPANAFTFSAY